LTLRYREALGETMDFKDVETKVLTAIERLFNNDAHLLQVDVNERSITHWLAVHLQEQFEGWHVDCEYNRNRTDKKTLRRCRQGEIGPGCIELSLDGLAAAGPEDSEGRTVYPDVIVHKRGTGKNLLAIEVKKTSSTDGSDFDMRRLQAYVMQLGYAHGLFLQLGVGERTGFSDCLWIHNGDRPRRA
jgi:hypothetical protein